MGLSVSNARKLLVLMVTAYLFSGSAEAWSWSWSSGSGFGWGSDNSGGGGSNSGGSSWGFGWSSNGTDTNWSWSSGSHHGSGSTHNGHNSGANHSSSPVSTSNNHTAPSNHSSNHTAPSNHSSNHTAPSNHSSGTGSTSNDHHRHKAPRNIVVRVWKKGFNYQEWVSKHTPFYTNDVLVFKYNHKENNVYLLRNFRSYMRCDMNRGKKLAAGSSPRGFKLLLRKTQPYYFASGDHNGCSHNNMKFSLTPIPH